MIVLCSEAHFIHTAVQLGHYFCMFLFLQDSVCGDAPCVQLCQSTIYSSFSVHLNIARISGWSLLPFTDRQLKPDCSIAAVLLYHSNNSLRNSDVSITEHRKMVRLENQFMPNT